MDDLDNEETLSALPRFAPPKLTEPEPVPPVEAAVAESPLAAVAPAEPVTVQEVLVEGVKEPAVDATVAGEVKPEGLPEGISAEGPIEDKAELDVAGQLTPEQKEQLAQLDPAVLQAIQAAVVETMRTRPSVAQGTGPVLSDNEIAHLAQKQHTPKDGLVHEVGQQSPLDHEGRPIISAGPSHSAPLVGTVAGIAGSAIGGIIGGVTGGIAGAAKSAFQHVANVGRASPEEQSIPMILPRVGEYRIEQIKKAADRFGNESEAFWQTSQNLASVRQEMERFSRERGVPMQDIVNEMKPGGELADLGKKFNEAVTETPSAIERKRSMDKAMDSYTLQYSRAQEEFHNPLQNSDPTCRKLNDGMKERVDKVHAGMEAKAAAIPAFTDDKGVPQQTHFERLAESVRAMAERIREVLNAFMDALKGGRQDNAPTP